MTEVLEPTLEPDRCSLQMAQGLCFSRIVPTDIASETGGDKIKWVFKNLCFMLIRDLIQYGNLTSLKDILKHI